MFNVKKEKLQEIENSFSPLKNGEIASVQNISKNLSSIFNKNISVSVVPANRSKHFFGMCVIPKEAVIDKIAESILNNDSSVSVMTALWKKCKDWTVEIDGNILTERFTNRELTSLLMHEVGHIIYTNSVPNRVNSIIQYKLADISMKDKASLSNKMYRSLVKIPIVQACICNDGESIKKEIKADNFAVKCGYSSDLISAITKIEDICSTRISTKDSVNSATNFSLTTLRQLKDRKASIVRKNFANLHNKLGDSYLKECVDDFIRNVLINKDDVIYESVDLVQKQEYYNEFLNIGKKRLDPVTQTQVDYIAAKIDDIKTTNDKVMMLSYLNSKVDLCEYYLSLLANPELSKKYIIVNSERELHRFINRLNQLRKIILGIKIKKDDNYVVFYPQDYEG